MTKAKEPKEYKSFEALTDKLLSVPRDVLMERIEQYREDASKNPRKRGPKPKRG